MSRDKNILKVGPLCKIAHVSRPGYYNWLKHKDIRQARENNDKVDFELILEAYKFKGYKKGARSIMYPIVMDIS